MKKIGLFWKIIISVYLFLAILIILDNLFTPFADFYIENIYPFLMKFSAVFSPLPFSLGEFVVIALIILLLLTIFSFTALMIIKKNNRADIARIYAKLVSVVCAAVLIPATLNCFMMYHGTPLSEKYFPYADADPENLPAVCDMMARNLNELSSEIVRDENGKFKLTCDLNETAKESMQNIGKIYPQLEGYYPNPKPIANSFILSQEYVTGVFLPFTLEANYNKDMCDINKPFTVCHELAHLKGIMSEDEANFIAFMACINSESAEFRYSGYVNALEYLYSYTNVIETGSLTEFLNWETDCYDMYSFLPDNYWEENSEKEIIPTEVVTIVSGTVNDTYLKVNGVSDGIESYARIVDLILKYYSVNPVE